MVPGNKRPLAEQWRGFFHSAAWYRGCRQWPQRIGEGQTFREALGLLSKAKGFENSLGYVICCPQARCWGHVSVTVGLARAKIAVPEHESPWGTGELSIQPPLGDVALRQ